MNWLSYHVHYFLTHLCSQRDDSITSILSLSDCSIVAMKWHMDLHIAAIITIEGKLLLWDFSSLTSKLENQS